jgi:hypothetical protein
MQAAFSGELGSETIGVLRIVYIGSWISPSVKMKVVSAKIMSVAFG